MAALRGSASVKGVVDAVTESVVAAQAQDVERFETATVKLTAQNPERLALVQGSLVRSLLEDLHPDGLSGADAQIAVERCVKDAAGWNPALDPALIVAVLMAALGAADPDEKPPSRTALAEHGSLLAADLLAQQPESAPGLHARLTNALAEIERAETMELP